MVPTAYGPQKTRKMPPTTPVKHCGRFDSSIELIVVNRLYPGDYLGEASLLTGVARNAAVEAVTAATVYEIDKADFEPFLIARPEMVEMLAHTLASRNSHRDSNAIAVPAATALTAIANQIRTFFRNDRGPRS